MQFSSGNLQELQIWIEGEDKFKNCCKIVAYGMDLWPSIGIDMAEFHTKQSINPTSTKSAVVQVGGYVNTFFSAVYLNNNEQLLTVLKVLEMTAATSSQNRKQFAVSYGFLPVFSGVLSEKFPDFWNHVMGNNTAIMIVVASPI